MAPGQGASGLRVGRPLVGYADSGMNPMKLCKPNRKLLPVCPRNAMRNRLDPAEGRAQRAEDRTAERDRIDGLQVRLATAEADGNALTVETAELTAQLNQAKQRAQEAQNAADAIRRADDVRRTWGRWVRLMQAWRGQ